jgi:hypothetical protein
LRRAGGNYRTLRKLIERHGISTDHFHPNWVRRGPRPRNARPLSEVLVEDSTYNRRNLKERLYELGFWIASARCAGRGRSGTAGRCR